jgi:hypothetical protein
MNNRLFVLLLFGLFIATACEKEHTPVVENVGLPLIVKEFYSDELYHEFTYNEQSLLKERKSKWFYALYHYNEHNQISSYEMYEDPGIYSSNWETAEAAMNRTEWVNPENTKISARATYTYEGVKLASITVTSIPGFGENTTVFSYDDNGRIEDQTFYSRTVVNGRKVYTYDDRGNVILEEQYYSSALICTRSFEYDNKHNPFKVFNKQGTPGIYTNENNIVMETLVLMDNTPGVDSVQVTESTYEYNNQGYPVTKDGFIRYEYK